MHLIKRFIHSQLPTRRAKCHFHHLSQNLLPGPDHVLIDLLKILLKQDPPPMDQTCNMVILYPL